MATIEERAKKNSAILSIKFGMNEKMAHALYVAASKEQRKIDIDKACKAHCEYCDHTCPKDGKCYILEYIRKAMEE